MDLITTVVPYDADKVRFVRHGITPRPVCDLLDDTSAKWVDGARRVMVKNDVELLATSADAFITPYSDPKFKSRMSCWSRCVFFISWVS